MNLTPFVFYAFGGVVGYLIADARGALIGLAVTLGVSLFVTFWNK